MRLLHLAALAALISLGESKAVPARRLLKDPEIDTDQEKVGLFPMMGILFGGVSDTSKQEFSNSPTYQGTKKNLVDSAESDASPSDSSSEKEGSEEHSGMLSEAIYAAAGMLNRVFMAYDFEGQAAPPVGQKQRRMDDSWPDAQGTLMVAQKSEASASSAESDAPPSDSSSEKEGIEELGRTQKKILTRGTRVKGFTGTEQKNARDINSDLTGRGDGSDTGSSDTASSSDDTGSGSSGDAKRSKPPPFYD